MTPRHQDDTGNETVTREVTKVRRPKQYRVLIHNDDYTTMDFVVSVLERIFKKTPSEAVQIMLSVHHKGHGVCGIYPREIAETKVDLVHRAAAEKGYPLKCSMEEA